MLFSEDTPKNFQYKYHLEFYNKYKHVPEICASWCKGVNDGPLPTLLVRDCREFFGLVFEEDDRLDSTATEFFAQMSVSLPGFETLTQTHIYPQNRGIDLSQVPQNRGGLPTSFGLPQL